MLKSHPTPATQTWNCLDESLVQFDGVIPVLHLCLETQAVCVRCDNNVCMYSTGTVGLYVPLLECSVYNAGVRRRVVWHSATRCRDVMYSTGVH
jgi:hypothetical protein